MYSYKQRKKAIETYLRTQSVSETLRVLGYPSSKELYTWIHEYQQNGKLHKKRVKPERIYYTEEEKTAAVQFYHDNKGSYQDAADKLGYPSSAQLRLWVIAAEKERENASLCAGDIPSGRRLKSSRRRGKSPATSLE